MLVVAIDGSEACSEGPQDLRFLCQIIFEREREGRGKEKKEVKPVMGLPASLKYLPDSLFIIVLKKHDEQGQSLLFYNRGSVCAFSTV